MGKEDIMKSSGIMVFPGTFDPFTKGHLDLVERAQHFCVELRILVFDNSAKTPVMLREDRMTLIRRAVEHLDHVIVVEGEGLLADYCKTHRVDAIVRGIRNAFQFEEECVMAELNKKLSGGVETLILSAAELRHVSSTLVREIARFGGDISSLVPESIKEDIERSYGR